MIGCLLVAGRSEESHGSRAYIEVCVAQEQHN